MSKNTVSGSFFARMFPTASKFFLENASQDDVNKAEQEAAVLHQQMQSNGITPPMAPVTAPVAEAVTPPVAPVVPAPVAPVATAPVTPPGGPAAAPTVSPELTAMTTRATTAESQVTALTAQITALTSDRDRYKAWHDKHSNAATALPGTDATNRTPGGGQQTLSAASNAALEQLLKRKAAR